MDLGRNLNEGVMNILVLNCGSSSLKYRLIAMPDEVELAGGEAQRVGPPTAEPSRIVHRVRGQASQTHFVRMANHAAAFSGIMNLLSEEAAFKPEAIGHRVVHGGEKCHDSSKITAEIKDIIRECATLAPLHNPPNLGGIEACERVFSGTPNVAVFDTAFHHSMPPASYLYAIPYEYYEKYGIRKYGFHGTSHKFVAQATADFLGRHLEDLKLITCHLGNGASITAINQGKSIDTSMGMTPLNGLVMGTRCGDIDPAVVLYLVRQGMAADEVDKLLNKKSGLLGVAGIGSSDMRDVIDAAECGNEQAKRALWMFVHRLVSYIGSYHTILGGADAVVFTGGIGENSAYIRTRIIAKLSCLGCLLDETVNHDVVGRPAIVSMPESTLKAVVMPTNEELMIARETHRLLKETPKPAGAVVQQPALNKPIGD